MSTTRLLFVHALSPLHAGTGQSVGAIDLAIARDRATEHPCVPGSSIKGSLRDVSNAKGRKDTIKVFGPEKANASDHAGAVAFGDANLLLLPVRSVAGTFAWVTSPFVLARFARDAKEAGLKPESIPTISALEGCSVCQDTSLRVGEGDQVRVVFEDLDLQPSTDTKLHKQTEAWATWLGDLLFHEDEFWKQMLRQKLCVVHDDVMTFLARHATDVCTRITLEKETKTVKEGQLWTEENLPSETILVSLVACMPNQRSATTPEILSALQALTETNVQFGGNATVGRGRCRLVLKGA